MNRTRPAHTTALLAVAAAALVAASTGGAVAGSMITGAQIKNGTVTGDDVRSRSLPATDLAPAARNRFDAVQRYEHRRTQESVPAGGQTQLSVTCSPGRHVLGASGFWSTSDQAVQVVLLDNSTGATAYAVNALGDPDTLKVEVICAVVSGRTLVRKVS